MQMINMMYLVLMALLALNTGKEVLAAFRSLEISIENAITQQEVKIDELRSKISQIYNNDQENPAVKDFYNYSIKINEKAQIVKDKIAEVKAELEIAGGGYVDLSHGLLELEQTDNNDFGPHYMGPPSEGGLGIGDEIREALNLCRIEWMEMVDNDTNKVKLHTEIPQELNVGDGETVSWSYTTFHVPLSAVMATLSELGSRVRSSEITMYNHFIKELGADVISVDRMAPLVMAESKFVEPGKEYNSEIFLAAWNSTQSLVFILVHYLMKQN